MAAEAHPSLVAPAADAAPTPQRRRARLFDTDLPRFSLALFLLAGVFKADPRLSFIPVDLTLLCALAVAGFCGLRFFRDGFGAPQELGWLVLIWAAFIPPLLWTDSAYPYPREKIQRLYTLTFLASVAPLFLLRTRQDLERFFNAFLILALILGLQAVLLIATGTSLHRVTVFGSNTINLGRAVGLALIWVVVRGLDTGFTFRRLFAIAVLGVTLIGAGSRGPIAATVFAFFVISLRLPGRSFFNVAGVAVLLGAILAVGLSVAPGGSSRRVEAFFVQGQIDESGEERLDQYDRALSQMMDEPFGIGWGGYAVRGRSQGFAREYPHNFVLEVGVEAGWLGLVVFLGVILLALRRSWVHARRGPPAVRMLLAMVVYYVINASFSGSLNDNRILFVAVAAGVLAARFVARGDGPAPPRRPRRRLLAHLYPPPRDTGHSLVARPSPPPNQGR